MSFMTAKQRNVLVVVTAAIALLLVARIFKKQLYGDLSTQTPAQTAVWDKQRMDQPSELISWPWPKASRSTPHPGVTHWLAKAKDGTTADLLCFDFAANPNLRLELYAQDEDDTKPFDNVVKFWPMGVGQATQHLNKRLQTSKSGQVVAAWNGPFFGYYRSAPIPDETAFHLAPVVLRGKVFHNTGNHRWTFGVRYQNGQPVFKTFHLPGQPLLEKEFDYASGTVQCLIKDGKPLKLEPFPKGKDDFRKAPVKSTPQEVGHIPYFDHAKFARVSLAWSQDNKQLYMLLIKELDSESASIDALQRGVAYPGGWLVSDIQRFWLSMMKQGKIWNAINNDAGDVAQMTLRQADGRYLLVSPRGDHPKFDRRVFTPEFKDVPQGGALMYFYVSDKSVR